MLQEEKIRLCFVGNPNVGKSTLINRLLNINKLKIDKDPGTTKEITEINYIWRKKIFTFIDTAGVYKKKNINFNILVRAIKSSDIVVLILEATLEKLDKLHKKLSDYSLKTGKGLIIIFNKWDLIEKKRNEKKKLINFIKDSLSQFNTNKVLFISALRDTDFNNIFKYSSEIKSLFNKNIQTSILNKWLKETLKINPPIRIKGKEIKFKYITQTKIYPPTFTIFSNYPKKINLSYKKFLEKRLKLDFKLQNIPVFLKFFATENPYIKKK